MRREVKKMPEKADLVLDEDEKKPKHLKDFSEEEIYMIRLMADIFIKHLLEKRGKVQ